MPTVGVQRTDFLGTESQKRPFASAFLMKGICRTGILFCFSGYIRGKSRTDFDRACGNASVYFPESKESGFILDMDYNIQQQINQVMEVEAVNDTVLRGRKRSAYWAYRQDLYFMPYFPNPLRIPCTRILFRK